MRIAPLPMLSLPKCTGNMVVKVQAYYTGLAALTMNK